MILDDQVNVFHTLNGQKQALATAADTLVTFDSKYAYSHISRQINYSNTILYQYETPYIEAQS